MKTDTEAFAEVIRARFRKGEARLPLLPKAVLKVQKIVNDESKGASDIAKALAECSTFSATVLRIANSPEFKNGTYEIRSLPMAVQRLGGRKTLQLMVAISSKLHFNVKDKGLQKILNKNKNDAMYVAVAARHLAQILRGTDPEEAFLAGMLHDIGVQAVVCAVPDLLAPLAYEDQIKIIQTLHREMGGRLLNYWEMPDAFEIIATHHGIESDDRPRDKLIDFVDAANFLIQSHGHKVLFDPIGDIDPLQYAPIQRIGAGETHLAAVEIELEDAVKHMGKALG
ncbi:MAG TPA: HDOD domain-containing protein [Mariprofundaceae bacterium]|nr:HDOD domain-containing protein [Mariprofundaceae bacterium]